MSRQRHAHIAVLLLLLACGCARTAAAPAARSTRVLFIGNSLTYSNDLPGTVAAIARADGQAFEVAAAAAPNAALIDHLNGASNALELLHDERWTHVVMQQGPTTTPIGRDSLVIWAKQWDSHIRATGAAPALLQVWPIGARWDRMSLVHESYHAAAAAIGGLFIPAGDAWTRVHDTDSTIVLYSDDAFHPALAGSFLAALTIYETLTGRDVRSIPAQNIEQQGLHLPEETWRVLQSAAHHAVHGSKRP